MKKRVTILLLAGSLMLAAAARADEPIWVDGNGNIINGPGNSGGTGATTPIVTAPVEAEEPEQELPEGAICEDAGDAEADSDAPPKWAYESTVLTAAWQGETVQVLAVGSQVSIIRQGKENREVYTRALTFAEDAEEGKALAIITAPKTGRISMRKTASSRGAIIMKCQAGRIVPVLGLTKKYALVQYEDAVGYVLRSSLTFLDPSEGEAEFAYIAYKGNPRSKNTVKVRQKGASTARILDEFPCGQRVTVIQRGDKWTEIEAENLRCFILSEFLTTVDEATAQELPVRGIGAKNHATSTDLP